MKITKDLFTFHIFKCILELAWPKMMKSTLEQQYMLSVLHSQYHACWCSGDFRNQSISTRGIDSQSRNIPSPASEELILSNSSWAKHALDSYCQSSNISHTKSHN